MLEEGKYSILKTLNCEPVYKSFENMLSSVLKVPFKEPAVKAFSLRPKGDIIYNYSH